jgi:O-antigen ligase
VGEEGNPAGIPHGREHRHVERVGIRVERRVDVREEQERLLVQPLALAALQAVPLPEAVVASLSPRSFEIRRSLLADPASLAEEKRILGVEPTSLDARPALSVDPGASTSALRTGCALVALLLVATTVVALRGPRGLALALLVSGAFQALYGALVLVSGHGRIWNTIKLHYLDCATGTFVNRNHFACFLACALSVGFALFLSSPVDPDRPRSLRERILDRFGARGSRALLLGLLVLVVLAGLLLSFSRAGIGLGLAALLAIALAAGRRGLETRLVATLLLLAVAAVPLAQIGSERLTARYARAPADLVETGGRGEVWLDALAMGSAFPVFGSGFGSFAAAYPLFRSPGVRLRYDHAHNDAVQAIAEGGAVAIVFLAFLLFAAGRGLIEAASGRFGVVAIGLAVGLAAFLLHSLVDFNFHIPANAAVAVILAGALEGVSWNDRS